MKRIILLALLLPSLAFAQQPPFVRNDSNTSTINGANLRQGSAAVDSKGIQSVSASDPSSGEKQSVIPVSNATDLNGVGSALVGFGLGTVDAVEAASTTTVINATAHVARVGDVLYFTSGTAGNIGVWSPVSAVTANTITIANALPATPAAADGFQILRPQLATKAEDSAAASGDALVGVASVRNTSLGAFAVDQDYQPIGTGTHGNMMASLIYDTGFSNGQQAIKVEDGASATANPVVSIGAVREDALTVNTDTSGDWTYLKTDAAGRTITTLAPAGETWQQCTSPITNTTRTQIKAAVASNRIYVTHFTCSNTSAVASLLYVEDGTTPIYVGMVPIQAAGGNWNITLPVPLRLTSNTALNVSMVTTATSTTCCASGYISVN